MKKVITIILVLCSLFSKAQTYNPSLFTVSNKSYGVAQAVPTDARSQYWDNSNFVARDYQSTTEVNTYLNLAKYRTGHFPIYIHSGGTLGGGGVWVGGITQVWFYKDSTGNANLVRWYTDSTATTGVFFAIANNLSEGNPTTIKTNLSLQNVNNTSDATKNAATVALTNHTIDGSLNTLLNIGNGSLTNSTIGLTLGSTGTDITITGTPASLGGSLNINVPSGSASNRGAITSSDWIRFSGKVDSTSVSNDSVYDWHNGTHVFRYIVVTGPNNWKITGNAGTISATNFLGTTDNVQLNFRVNNIASGIIDHIQDNLFFGYNAGLTNISIHNTAIGNYSLMVSSGVGNTAVGDSSLKKNTSGTQNTGVGANALYSNTNGSSNSAFGLGALASLSSGSNNTGIGEAAAVGLVTGQRNTVIGANAMNQPISGDDNVVVGRNGLRNMPSASQNVALGAFAFSGSSSVTSNSTIGNIGIGYSVGLNSTIGINNTLVGREVNNGVNIGDSNIVVGAYNSTASTSKTIIIGVGTANTGNLNTFVGSLISSGTTFTGSKNTFLGANIVPSSSSLANNIILSDGDGNQRLNFDNSGNMKTTVQQTVSDSTTYKPLMQDASGNIKQSGSWIGSGGWTLLGNSGTVDGTNFLGTIDNIPLSFRVNSVAAGRLTSNGNQTYYGYQAGNGANSLFTTAVGYQSLSVNTGNYNQSFGYQSLQNNTSGSGNSSFGLNSLRSNTTGINNSSFGNNSLHSNTSGFSNVGLGYSALDLNITGSKNTAIGLDALGAQTVGDSSVAVGFEAGFSVTTGKTNLFVGTGTGQGVTTGSYNTIIGNRITGLSSSLSNNIVISDGAGTQRVNIDNSGNLKTTVQSSITDTTTYKPLVQDASGNFKRSTFWYSSSNSSDSSGTYTPTFFNISNITSSTPFLCQWTRVGNRVSVWGSCAITPTLTNTQTNFELSLPIASNFITNNDGVGTVTGFSGTLGIAGGINVDSVTDRAGGGFPSVDTNSENIYFSFSYTVK